MKTKMDEKYIGGNLTTIASKKGLLRKIIATFLMVAMMTSFGSVMASEVEENDYVVTYQAEEITDIDTLLDMALAEQTNQPSRARAFSIGEEPVAEDELSVNQLLEVREYADGTTEKEYAKTVLKVTDENGVIMPRGDVSQSNNASSTNEGVTLSSTAYYVVRDLTGILIGMKVNRVSSTITRSSGSPVPTSLVFLAWYDTSKTKTVSCSAATSQTYQYTTGDTTYYAGERLFFQTHVSLNNNTEVVTIIDIYAK